MIAPGSWMHSKRPLDWFLANKHAVFFLDKENPNPKPSEFYKFEPYPELKSGYFNKFARTVIYKAFSYLSIIIKLRKIWLQFKPDIAHLYWVDHRAYQCIKAGMRPIVLSVLGSDINDLFDNRDSVRFRSVAFALRNADLVLVDSMDLIEKCKEIGGGNVKVKHFQPGIDTKLFSPRYRHSSSDLRRQSRIPGQAKVIVSIRALMARYNHHLILEAFAIALPRFTYPTFLLFKNYNPITPTYMNELIQKAKQLEIEQFVRWLDYVPHSKMPEIYYMADLIVNFPSIDAFPVTFLEAAACECPLVTCRLPAYEGTFATRYFHIVDEGNIEALANAFVEEINGKTGATPKMLSEARQWICVNYDETNSMNRLIDIYETLLHR